MGILSWIVMGLIVGVLAKFLMPGKDPEGSSSRHPPGIVGAFVGGYVGSFLRSAPSPDSTLSEHPDRHRRRHPGADPVPLIKR